MVFREKHPARFAHLVEDEGNGDEDCVAEDEEELVDEEASYFEVGGGDEADEEAEGGGEDSPCWRGSTSL